MEIKENPEVAGSPPREWKSPRNFGGQEDDSNDDSIALQQAIDSGASTIYLPNGTWIIRNPVIIRGKVCRLVGCEATVKIERLGNQPAIIIQGGESPVVVIERLEVEGTAGTFLQINGSQTVSIQECHGLRITHSGLGDLFFDDVHLNGPLVWKSAKIWARQLGVDVGRNKILNQGGHFWGLGLFVTQPGTLVTTIAGGRSEVLGGLCLSNGGWKSESMFVLEDAEGSFVMSEASFQLTPFQTIVGETWNGQSRKLSNQAVAADGKPLPSRAGGVALPFFTSGRAPETP